jgi:hypothetical protein
MPTDKLEAINLAPSTNKGDDGEGPFLRVTDQFYNGRYDVDTTNLLFWRGDTRPPSQVFQTGFSSRYVRDGKAPEIVWRAAVDDIVPASSVCLARDIRGAAFFPYPPDDSEVIEDTNYLYAMVVPRAACTYRIQQMAEFAETDEQDWRDPARFGYDPAWSDYDNTSCVWQFAEYAVHAVPGAQIIAGWKCTRTILVKKKDEERVQAGIRFRLHGATRNPGCLNLQAWSDAQAIASTYAREYPRKYPQFLSYWGIIEALAVPVSSQDQARLTARQLQPILTADDSGWSIRDDGGGSDTGSVKLGAPARAKPLSHGCT